jgi:hypothetical protein
MSEMNEMKICSQGNNWRISAGKAWHFSFSIQYAVYKVQIVNRVESNALCYVVHDFMVHSSRGFDF